MHQKPTKNQVTSTLTCLCFFTANKGANEAEKKQTKFRGGCEPIQHVLPPDVQVTTSGI